MMRGLWICLRCLWAHVAFEYAYLMDLDSMADRALGRIEDASEDLILWRYNRRVDMPRRNNRDDTTGRRGDKPRRDKGNGFEMPAVCPCHYGQPCVKHGTDGSE